VGRESICDYSAVADESYLFDLRGHELVERLAFVDAGARGGTAAAITVAIAASITEMAARLSRDRWEDAEGAAAEARALLVRIALLAQTDAQAYEEVHQMLVEVSSEGSPGRDRELGQALDFAAGVPLAIAEAGSEAASLAAFVSEKDDPNARGDAAVAAMLAEAGVRAVAHLIEINLATTERDPRLKRAHALTGAASGSAKHAVELSR
jgi:methenyltetrahydrofolate cyclohydrolase